ncbi:hypothetical protein ACFL00_02130 [Pseudomonadota bacterium]
MSKKITISFEQGSKIIEQFRKDEDHSTAKKFKSESLTFEFNEAPPTKEYENKLAIWLIQQRSPYWATIALRVISDSLKEGKELPDYVRYMLALAIDRTIEDGDEVAFIYGKNSRRGSPRNDPYLDFYIFQIIEEEYSEIGRLDINRGNEDGAFQAAQKKLESDKLYKSVHDLKRIRREVIQKAKENLEYMLRLFQYLEGMGYKATIIRGPVI